MASLVFGVVNGNARAFAIESGGVFLDMNDMRQWDITDDEERLTALLGKMSMAKIDQTLDSLGFSTRKKSGCTKAGMIASFLHHWNNIKANAEELISRRGGGTASSSHTASSFTAFSGEAHSLNDEGNEDKNNNNATVSVQVIHHIDGRTVSLGDFMLNIDVGLSVSSLVSVIAKGIRGAFRSSYDFKQVLMRNGIYMVDPIISLQSLGFSTSTTNHVQSHVFEEGDSEFRAIFEGEEDSDDRESISDYVEYLHDASDFDTTNKQGVTVEVKEAMKGRVLFLFSDLDGNMTVDALKNMIAEDAERRANAMVLSDKPKKVLTSDCFMLRTSEGMKMEDGIIADYTEEDEGALVVHLMLRLKGGAKGVKQQVKTKEKVDAFKSRAIKVKEVAVLDELQFFKHMIDTFMTHVEHDSAGTIQHLLSALDAERLGSLSLMLGNAKGATMEVKMSDIAIKMFGVNGEKLENLYGQCESLSGFATSSMCYAMSNAQWNISNLKKCVDAVMNQKIGQQMAISALQSQQGDTGAYGGASNMES
ncbi:unnamed protein product [Effrenium voratum]|nr:unnamed protein product [Effrenium voratum]